MRTRSKVQRSPEWLTRAMAGRDQWPQAVTAICGIVLLGMILWQLGGLHALLSNTTTTGGDTGAHYMMPAVLSEFVSHGHLTGWFPGWYDGLPLYSFYFVLPDLLVALASHVIAYNVAFKLATVAGSLLLPVACYLLGRGFRLRRPFPELLAAGSLLFLFEQSYTINGGNLYSTLAGEYSFSFSLSVIVLFLAVVARGIQTGRHIALAATLLAVSLAAHVLPLLLGFVGLGVLLLMELGRPGAMADDGLGALRGVHLPLAERARTRKEVVIWVAAVVGLGLGAMAWWLVPFIINQRYANPMGYNNSSDFIRALFPAGDRYAIVLALVGGVFAILRRSRFGIFITVLTIESAMAYRIDPQGAIFNDRLLPLYYLSLYLAAAWTLGVGWIWCMQWVRRLRLARFARMPQQQDRPRELLRRPGSLSGALVGLVVSVAIVAGALPAPQEYINKYLLAPVNAVFGTTFHDGIAQDAVAGWASYNFSGMEGRGASWAEFRGIMSTANRVGATIGCGRMFWEYESNQDRFGTPMALMLLPHFTHGCIASQEGLLFESSATTPYHFLNQSLLSVAPSQAQVGLNYHPTNVAEGVKKLQVMGVRYYLVSAPSLVLQAEADPLLSEVAVTQPFAQPTGSALTWHIYEVADSPVVVPLTHLPVVVPGLGSSASSWKNGSTAWYDTATSESTPLASTGPKSWPVTTNGVAPDDPVDHPGQVTHVKLSMDKVTFDVDKAAIGKPVLVRISFFPNWKVSGATGPFRVTPNFMVVVPTSRHVTLTYGATPANWFGETVTLLALIGIVAAAVVSRRQRRRERTKRSSSPIEVAASTDPVASVTSGDVGGS